MDGQQFCLKWDGFQGSVTSVFDHLRRDSELVDVTLCCDGQRVQAHRMMLSACSPYFRELFKGLPYQQLAVFLKDTSAADLTAIVEFMYKGSVNVAQSQLASFIKTAEMLQVRGLSGGDDDKPAPPSRQTAPPSRQAAPPSRQAALPSPIPRRPPEPPLPPPPPPPPPSASPPPKRRRASEPLPSPDAASPGAASPGRPGTPAGSPRPASLPSPVPVTPLSARRPPSSPRETPQQQQQQSQQQQQEQEHHPQQQQQQQQRDQEQAQQQERQHQQQLQNQNQHHQRQQQQQQQYHQEQQHHQGQQQRQGLHGPLSDEMVKVEKLDLTDDEVSLEDTLDHVAELERYGGGEAAVGGQDQLQLQLNLQQQRMNLAAATAAAQQLGAVPGPSQRLSEDGTSQGGGRRYTCETCGQHYLHPVSLKLHRKAHEGLTTCGLCGRTLSMVASLRAHLRSVHGLSEQQVRQVVPTATRRRQARHQSAAERSAAQEERSAVMAEFSPAQ